MKLKELMDELADTPDEQEQYEVVIIDNGAEIPLESIRWDHAYQRVVLNG